MMQQPMLLVSLHYAQLHYQRLLTAAGLDMNEAANNPPAAKFYKLQGVQEFLDILLKLGEMPAVRPTTQRLDKLNQKV
jgi:hypothetical protein